MKADIKDRLASISSAINKVNGLYARWAQRHNINVFAIKIFYSLEQEGSITQREICERLKVPKQSINNVVIALKNDGYISLLPSEADKREKIIVLTEQGRAYSQGILDALHRLEESVVQQMGEQLVEQLVMSATAYGHFFEQGMLKEDNQ